MATATATPTKKGGTPIAKLRDRGVCLTVFPNTATRDDGTAVSFHNTVIESRYKDKDGNWQSGSSFSKDQLYALRFLIDEALRTIITAEHQKPTDE